MLCHDKYTEVCKGSYRFLAKKKKVAWLLQSVSEWIWVQSADPDFTKSLNFF